MAQSSILSHRTACPSQHQRDPRRRRGSWRRCSTSWSATSHDNIAEAEGAVAQTIGNLRLVEDDAREAREAVGEWGSKAAAASRRADELRAEGNAAEADRFDGLAKIALRRQIGFEEQAQTLETQAPSRPSWPRSSRTA